MMKNPLAMNAYTLLTLALVVQAAHVVEHVAQVIQKFVLGWTEAHGLLGSLFDLEWVHFAYNSGLEAALVVILVSILHSEMRTPGALRAVVGLQGYHAVEHVVKIFQHVFQGVAAPKGILGVLFPVIWLHFWFNLIVLGLMAWVWWTWPRVVLYPQRSGGARWMQIRPARQASSQELP